MMDECAEKIDDTIDIVDYGTITLVSCMIFEAQIRIRYLETLSNITILGRGANGLNEFGFGCCRSRTQSWESARIRSSIFIWLDRFLAWAMNDWARSESTAGSRLGRECFRRTATNGTRLRKRGVKMVLGRFQNLEPFLSSKLGREDDHRRIVPRY